MLEESRIVAAAENVVAAALSGGRWEEALAGFAHASDARDAVLMRNARSGMISAISTPDAAEAVAQYAAGRSPPNSRYLHVENSAAAGFRVDLDDYSASELARDPYYQEFLHPNGLFWHANAVLSVHDDEYVEISLKRRTSAGPYQRADAELLDRRLPMLRAAARIAGTVFAAETRGGAAILRQSGRAVFQLDRTGHVLAESLPATAADLPVRVVGRRLTAADEATQAAIDRALGSALVRQAALGLALIVDAAGNRSVLQVHPATPGARDVFGAAAALAVLIDIDSPVGSRRLDPAAVAMLFSLTAREAQVACLLAEGRDLDAIALRLRIAPQTIRTYLKNVFGKTGVRRQAELVALLSQLRF